MGKYNWKDDYGYDEKAHPTYWLSVNGEKGLPVANSTRNRPAYSKGHLTMSRQQRLRIILSSGIHDGAYNTTQSGDIEYIGQGIANTIWKKSITTPAQYEYHTFRDMTIGVDLPKMSTYLRYRFYNCDIKYVDNIIGAYNCKLRGINAGLDFYSDGTLSIINLNGLNIEKLQFSRLLYDNCEIIIKDQAELNSAVKRFIAFNKCKFRIGNEPEYTELIGDSDENLKESFINRCEALGLTVPLVPDSGNNEKAGRWVFSNNSTIDGLVLPGSEIHKFEKAKFITFGYTSNRDEFINITEDPTTPSSFSPAYASSEFDFKNQNISLKEGTNISNRLNLQTKSNIIWLGGINKLKLIDIIHDFPKDYGIFLDTTDTIDFMPVEEIETGEYYIVRSTDSNSHTITYNGKTYSSALVDSNNVFVGVDQIKEFTKSSDKVVVYKIKDHTALHQTIKMRVVSNIPTDKIDPDKSLTKGYWYYVEHKTDQTNTSEYVTYNGKQYKVGSSFLAGDITSFAATSGVHLRRCWKDSYNENDTSDQDYNFWKNIQKPKWIEVLPNDLRCLMKNNNPLEAEMQTDGKEYITSGHPDFYTSILGSSGVKVPAYPITGAFVQLELHLTTQNPM